MYDGKKRDDQDANLDAEIAEVTVKLPVGRYICHGWRNCTLT